jgi:3alpha(or 20beta)-hydroxysteroid dehydrogenase
MDKVAVITGGARGQGAAHSRLFAARGYVVYALDVIERAPEELVRTTGGEDLDIRFRKLDVTSDQDWAEFAQELDNEHGSLDVLVNNAGVTAVADIDEESFENFQRVMTINAGGQFLGTKHLWGLLKADGGGAVVNIASTFASVSAPGYASYSASKAAVLGLTRATALDGASAHVRVNAVSPGAVQTQMLKEEAEMLAARGRAFSSGSVTVDHAATPEEVSQLVYYLASDEARFVTGADFTIDGGYTAR